MTDEEVETVARAIAYEEGNAGDSGVWPKWSDYRDHARAAIIALAQVRGIDATHPEA